MREPRRILGALSRGMQTDNTWRCHDADLGTCKAGAGKVRPPCKQLEAAKHLAKPCKQKHYTMQRGAQYVRCRTMQLGSSELRPGRNQQQLGLARQCPGKGWAKPLGSFQSPATTTRQCPVRAPPSPGAARSSPAAALHRRSLHCRTPRLAPPHGKQRNLPPCTALASDR